MKRANSGGQRCYGDKTDVYGAGSWTEWFAFGTKLVRQDDFLTAGFIRCGVTGYYK